MYRRLNDTDIREMVIGGDNQIVLSHGTGRRLIFRVQNHEYLIIASIPPLGDMGVGEYTSEQDARKDYGIYNDRLDRKATIEVDLPNRTARIVGP